MKNKRAPRCVVLLSGGLDSAVALYEALHAGYRPVCLSFDYGQRHKREIASARKVARAAGCVIKVVTIELPWKGSSLLDRSLAVPQHTTGRLAQPHTIPSTYVPARNIIFLSFALSFAEAIGARKIFIGANAIDYSGYPDCRPEFYRAFSAAARCGTKAGVEKKAITIETPLIDLTKRQIIALGKKRGVPFERTWSCYQGGRAPCGKCDSCLFRAKGFKEAGLTDPLIKR